MPLRNASTISPSNAIFSSLSAMTPPFGSKRRGGRVAAAAPNPASYACARTTFVACGPFGPCVDSNSTFAPSASDL